MSQFKHDHNTTIQGSGEKWQKSVLLKCIDPDFTTDDVFNIACKVGKIERIKWKGPPDTIQHKKRLKRESVHQSGNSALIKFGEHDEAARFLQKFNGYSDFAEKGQLNFVVWDKFEKQEFDGSNYVIYSEDEYRVDDSRPVLPADRYIEDIFLKIKYVEVQQRRISNEAVQNYTEKCWCDLLDFLENIRWSFSDKFSEGTKFKLYFDRGVRSERDTTPIYEDDSLQPTTHLMSWKVKASFLDTSSTGTGATKIQAKHCAGKRLILNLLGFGTERLISELLGIDVGLVRDRISALKRCLNKECQDFPSDSKISKLKHEHHKVTKQIKSEYENKLETLQNKMNQVETEKAKLILEHNNTLFSLQDEKLMKMKIHEDLIRTSRGQSRKVTEMCAQLKYTHKYAQNADCKTLTAELDANKILSNKTIQELKICETKLETERDQNARNVAELNTQISVLSSNNVNEEVMNDTSDSITKHDIGCQVKLTTAKQVSTSNPDQSIEECAELDSAKTVSDKEEELNSRIDFWEEENNKLILKHSKEQMELNFKLRKYKKSEEQFEEQGIQLKTVKSDLKYKNCELETCKNELLTYKCDQVKLKTELIAKSMTLKRQNDLSQVNDDKISKLEKQLQMKTDELESISHQKQRKMLSYCKERLQKEVDKLSKLEVELNTNDILHKYSVAKNSSTPVPNDLNNNVANVPTDLGDGEILMLRTQGKIKKEARS